MKSRAVWQKSVAVNGQQIMFKLDTGAAVTAIPKRTYSKKLDRKLSSSCKRLCGRSNVPIEVEGHFTADISYKGSVVKQHVYVVPGLATPLLGLPAIQDLCLLSPVEAIVTSETTYMKQCPRVFTCLGKLEGVHKIKLAIPFALCPLPPRHVPLPLRGKVQEDLNRMEKMRLILPITEATD